MQAVVLIGLQASGKTSFYRERLFETHVRISLDMLRTRYRERALVRACVEAKQPFAVDNTNPTVLERSIFIEQAKVAGFSTAGYYFRSCVAECVQRNASRTGRRRIPERGILGTFSKLELPTLSEGFDELWYVRMVKGEFCVERWKDEV